MWLLTASKCALVAIESRVFLTTPSDQPFYTLYSPNATDLLDGDLEASADRLLSVIASLGVRPYVRYYCPPGSATSPAKAMASRLQLKLDDYFAHERRKAENYMKNQAPDLQTSTVIVLDRSVDVFAPLIHEFTYQAMVHDLIDLESGDKYVYNTQAANGEVQRVEAELAEAIDPLWTKLRHQHISVVSQTLVERLGRLVSENVGIKAITSISKQPKLCELRAALSELPEFKRLQSSYALHSDLACKCLQVSKKRGLTLLSDFEMASICDVYIDTSEIVARSTSNSHENDEESLLEPRLIAMLDDKTLEIRLLFLYLVHVNGGIASDRRRLEEVPQCLTDNDKRAAENEADVQPSSQTRYMWKGVDSYEQNELGLRFAPAVKSIVSEHIAGTLSMDMFPWAQEAPPEGIPKHILDTNATSLR
ncbi:syntaxin binding protein 1, partial [Coemansia aciculifera]